MPTALVLAAILWPVTLAAAMFDQLDGHRSTFSSALYATASRVCHRKPERSFFTAGHQWPVCGRCTGLYLAGPIGAIAAYRARRRPSTSGLRAALLGAALPTMATILVEWWSPSAMSSPVRLAAALPLGGAIAWALVHAASGPAEPIR